MLDSVYALDCTRLYVLDGVYFHQDDFIGGGRDGFGMWHAWENLQICTKCSYKTGRKETACEIPASVGIFFIIDLLYRQYIQGVRTQISYKIVPATYFTT